MELKRILVVDDDPKMEFLIKGLLSDKDVNVDFIHKPQNVVPYLDSIKHDSFPDLVMTDIQMPRLNGYELCQILKDKYPGLPVIVMSAYDDKDSISKAISSGALDFVSKSFDVHEFYSKIASVVN